MTRRLPDRSCRGGERSAGRARLGAAQAAAAAIALLAALAGATPAHAALDIGIGLGRVEGEFGSDESRSLDHLFLQAEFGGAGSRLLIRVPYVQIDKTGNVTVTPDGPIILGAGGPGRPSWQESEAGESESGFGDVYVRAETYLVQAGKGKKPNLGLVFDLKWPTADEKKGLGTGERDWGAGLNYVQPLGEVVQILGEVSYRFMGSPEGVKFDDRLRFAAGMAFVSSHASWRLGAEQISAVLDQVPVFDALGVPTGVLDVEDQRIARGEVVMRSGNGGTARLYLLTGLNDSSPDLGFGMVLSSGSQ